MTFLRLSLALLFAAAFAAGQGIPASFNHGVSSGDPYSDSIVLWTRVTPRVATADDYNNAVYNITWTVGTDDSLAIPVATGFFITNAARDFTVKVIAGGLTSGVQYYYRFTVNGSPLAQSPIGSFRLPPPQGQSLRRLQYAIFSCANWGYGWFNAYDAATRYDLDFWLHLGDFIYEYGIQTYPTPDQAVRFEDGPQGLQPPHDCVTLDDYRARHGLYRQDPGVQALSASAALIAIWDDHEVANNDYVDGAENQHPGEGDWNARKEAAIQAYHEWQPTRYLADNGNTTAQQFYRSFQFGDLATLLVTEPRLTARTTTMPYGYPDFIGVAAYLGFASVPPSQWNDTMVQTLLYEKSIADQIRAAPNATVTGEAQLAWMRGVTAQSVQSGTTWQLFAQDSVMFDSGGMAPDFEAAIQNAPDQATAAHWQAAISNLTGTNPAATATWTAVGLGFLEPLLGTTTYISTYMREVARVAYALGKYRIEFNTDNWVTYLFNRQEFFNVVAGATNAIIYGGDSHNAWAGVERINGTVIAAEFDGWSVTSPGAESLLPWVPADLLAAGAVASGSNPTSGLMWADLVNRGFMLATLDHSQQIVQFLKVSTIARTDYDLACAAQFLYPAKTGKPKSNTLRQVPCRFVPQAAPYASAISQNTAAQSSTAL